MYSVNAVSAKEIKYVIDRLNDDAVFELSALFGADYKSKTLQIISREIKNTFLLRLKETDEPVGVYGIIPIEGTKACGIFFLTTKNLYRGNMITILRGAKKQIARWEKEYRLIMDSCLKSNQTIIKWLTLLGFQPSELQDDTFQIYFKGDLNEYKY